MVAYLKLLIAKMKRDKFGQSAERGRKLLDQRELQLEEREASATEDEVAAASPEPDPTSVRSRIHKKPVRAPLPADLPRERVVVPAPPSCPCCGGKLVKLGEDVTETLEGHCQVEAFWSEYRGARTVVMPPWSRCAIAPPLLIGRSEASTGRRDGAGG